MLEMLKVSFIIYLIILIGAVIGLIVFGLYIGMYYHLGKPMALFMYGRIKSWTEKGIAVFEIISLTGNVLLFFAKEETGGYRRPHVTKKLRKPMTRKYKTRTGLTTIVLMLATIILLYKFAHIGIIQSAVGSMIGLIIPVYAWYRQPKEEIFTGDNRPQPLIMPKTVYSINGVDTIPLIDLHPPLHTDIKNGLNSLIELGIKTHEGLQQEAELNPDIILIPGYTMKSFCELYTAARQKYEFRVRVSDVSEAVTKNFDKNFRESLQAKEFNAKTKKRHDNTTLKYGYAALFIVCLGVIIKLLYFTFYGGK